MWKRWLLALLAASSASAYAQDATPTQIDWIRKNAVVFDTVKAGHGFEDLQPLKQLIGDARIVALGEPTHGSREVFQMKHRLLEFLVEALGFSIFSIEANMPESFRLNDYVLRGQWSPEELIRGMYFWTWATDEVREMVEWMRRHNAEVERRQTGSPVAFTGFDIQTPDVATRIVTGFVEKADPGYAPVVRKAAKAATSAARRLGWTIGVATRAFPAERARGRKFVYHGWIKTQNLQDGYAGLLWQCDVEPDGRALDKTQDRWPTGTTDWQRFEITRTVPIEATHIDFGALMRGRGKAWFDGLEVLIDGHPISDLSVDLDFEGRQLTGFQMPSKGYEVTLDPAEAKTGRQSLRIQDAPPPLVEGGSDPARAAELWQAVVTHLEQNRLRYHEQQDLLSVDWAIVNARLVVDSMNVREDGGRSGLAVRDRATARMVEWILDQSPKARIALWAHNTHVSRQPGSMGRFLEERFPGQMVALGFATGTGTYRAGSRAGKGVSEHGLEPPPPDSFERVFQASGLPRFILDLRKAAPDSPESGWLLERKRFRSIGSMEMEGSFQFRPLELRDSFDGIVWIEQTAAALPLPR